MSFPDGWPNFTEGQLAELKRLGLTGEYVQQLRAVLPIIRNHVLDRSKPNEVKDRLKEIEKLARDLVKKLQDSNASAKQVVALLDSNLWLAEQEDGLSITSAPLQIGEHVSNRYLPDLTNLVAAARVSQADVPKVKRGRSRTASSLPVKAVYDALMSGSHYSKQNYPIEMKPSAAENSKFRSIVGVCFEAAGGTADPLRAIRAFLASKRRN
jgi:hypothetical protein